MLIEVILFIILLGLFFYLDTRKPQDFPPGPKWLPILGSMLQVAKIRKKTGYLYKTSVVLAEKYGPVVGLRIGKDKIVIAYSADTIREVLTNEDLQGRPTGPFYETRTWGVRRGVLLTDEQFWSEQRRFVLRHLRDFGLGKRDMAHLVEEEATQLVKNIEKLLKNSNKGTLIRATDFFGVYILNALWSMMAGIRYNHDDYELKHLQNILAQLFANIDMVGSLFSQFPVLRYVAPNFSGYNFFLDIHKQMWKFLNNELEKHKITYNPNELRDFMDVYLNYLQSEEKSPSFSESQLIAICLDLFIAGSETTSKTLAFGLLYMIREPHIVKKAQEEIDRVVGRERMIQLSDRPNLPYVEGLVLESIRMFMIRAFGVPHRALRDTTLGGYFIPKDTMILANFHGLLTNNYEDPLEFKPERFLKNGRVVMPDTYLPFGFGKHRCLGESLAKANIFMFLGSLMQKFDILLPPGSKPPPTDGIDGATPGTVPFDVHIKYREFS